MSLAIASFLCSLTWFASALDELRERVRVARNVLFAYWVGHLLAIFASVFGVLKPDPSMLYGSGPVLGGICALLAGAHGVWRILSRSDLTRGLPAGVGPYRDPSCVPESFQPPRVLPPVASRAVARFLVGLLFASGGFAAVELPNRGFCERYPQICSMALGSH